MWNKQYEPIGHNYTFRRPALHPNCRSKLVFVFDLDAPFEDISGEDWVKGRTLEELQEQFGKGIGQMLHDGTISLSDAVKSGGLKAATLKELQDKYNVPETIRAIERKPWAPEFKRKAADLYYQFEQAGFIVDIHGVSRLNRLNKKGFVVVFAAQILDYLQNNHANYRQEDNRVVFFSDKMQLAVIQSKKDKKIITFIRMKKAKSEWKILTKS